MAKKRRLPWMWILIIAVLAAAAGKGVWDEVNDQVPVRTAAAGEGPIQAYVEERARTSLPHVFHVTMPLQGRVLPIEVEEGDAVEKGQLVVRIEDLDWVDSASQAQDIIVATKRTLEAMTAQIKAAVARADYTKWVWEANEKSTTSAISERDKRQSRWQYLDSVVKTEESQAMYHAIDAFYSIVKMLPSYVDRNLKRTQLACPVSGTVLKRHVWNEKMMNAGAPLLDIGDLSRLEVTADILTEEAVRIQPGDEVEIFGDAVGAGSIVGRVRRVEPEAFTKLSSLGVEQQRVAVKIVFADGTLDALKASGRTLGLGYRVRVRVITDEKAVALGVPRTALFRGVNGGWQLYRVEKGRAKLTDVEVGLMNDFQAEITAGLATGETVILAPESSISDGTRVAVEG